MNTFTAPSGNTVRWFITRDTRNPQPGTPSLHFEWKQNPPSVDDTQALRAHIESIPELWAEQR